MPPSIPIIDALTAGTAVLVNAIDAMIQHDDNIFDLLEEALANPVPAEALAQVQAVVDTHKAKEAEIIAKIAENTPVAPQLNTSEKYKALAK
jgi:hypothetical protein